MANYSLLKIAEADIENIARYTIQQFGIEQARIYRDGLFKSFEMITQFPLMGSNQYRIDKKGITIFRILGPGEDPLTRFNK